VRVLDEELDRAVVVVSARIIPLVQANGDFCLALGDFQNKHRFTHVQFGPARQHDCLGNFCSLAKGRECPAVIGRGNGNKVTRSQHGIQLAICGHHQLRLAGGICAQLGKQTLVSFVQNVCKLGQHRLKVIHLHVIESCSHMGQPGLIFIEPCPEAGNFRLLFKRKHLGPHLVTRTYKLTLIVGGQG
jgi:hypothetical protein